jgi:hypothetical protein
VNYGRIVLSAVAAAVVFFVYGFLVHGLWIAKDYLPHPVGVYRSGEDAKYHTPLGLAGIFVAILVFTTIYAKNHAGAYGKGNGAGAGARLGLLFGIFMAGAFAAVNYGTLHISGKLASEVGFSELIEWTLVGIVVGLTYNPGLTAPGQTR